MRVLYSFMSLFIWSLDMKLFQTIECCQILQVHIFQEFCKQLQARIHDVKSVSITTIFQSRGSSSPAVGHSELAGRPA